MDEMEERSALCGTSCLGWEDTNTMQVKESKER